MKCILTTQNSCRVNVPPKNLWCASEVQNVEVLYVEESFSKIDIVRSFVCLFLIATLSEETDGLKTYA